MGKFATYTPSTGRIVSVGSCDDSYMHLQPVLTGDVLITSINPAVPVGPEGPRDYYFDGTSVVPRPVLPINVSSPVILANDTDECILSGFPDPCVVFVNDTPYDVTGGTVTLTSPMAGQYKVSCDHWPYLKWETTVEAISQN